MTSEKFLAGPPTQLDSTNKVFKVLLKKLSTKAAQIALPADGDDIPTGDDKLDGLNESTQIT